MNINSNSEQEARKKHERKLFLGDILGIVLIAVVSGLLFGISFFGGYYLIKTTNVSEYCRKDELKNELKTKITNGADLEVVEDVFADRYKYSQDVREWNHLLEKHYYDSNTTLLQVLKDLRSDYFDDNTDMVQPTNRDTAYYSRLSMIIDEYKQASPFDGLDKNEQMLFVDLQGGLGDDYEVVRDKVVRIADELRSKNALVNMYLNTSNDSFRLSRNAYIATIVFGIFTLVFGIISIVENKRSRKERNSSK